MIYLSIVWHMHQPYYKNDREHTYFMPWVRLHAVKDYYDMLMIAREEKAKVSFNLTPVLLEQIEDYTQNNAKEIQNEIVLKDTSILNEEEKTYVLSNFFHVNHRAISESFRYSQLYKKRQLLKSSEGITSSSGFTTQDIRDIQILFNLAWLGEYTKRKDEEIKTLIIKERNFTEQDKKSIYNKQMEIMRRIIPLYKETFAEKTIEISTSPFYHPILPLLIDTNITSVCSPNIKLPSRFTHPEDARKQIKEGKTFIEKLMDKEIQGLWPSEGAVSDEALNMAAQEGFNFVMTGDAILKKTSPSATPYRCYKYKDVPLYIFFRDTELSDKIGFTYAQMDEEEAVEDFINTIKRKTADIDNPVVSIILDGENAWEYYRKNGYPFLKLLYQKLNKDNDIILTTPSQYLQEHKDEILSLNNDIWPGSWINANFKVWIGDEEDNKSWELLKKTKEDLKEISKQSEKEIYIAEGSDWNWWYGLEHNSQQDLLFDNLYRVHLKNAYLFSSKTPPSILGEPIKKLRTFIEPQKKPTAFITPIIDGKVTSYYEWLGAGEYEDIPLTMHPSTRIIKKMYWCFDEQFLYLRIDCSCNLEEKTLKIILTNDQTHRIIIEENKVIVLHYSKENKPIGKGKEGIKACIGETIEIGIERKSFNLKEREIITLFAEIRNKDKQAEERFPRWGYIQIIIPDSELERKNWIV
ncbi:MAG: glycoside hydrolase family 57 protein [Campylobacterota bacterium]|nr:glycoside hydrolase family 57 protein [Campylobacterota bacterium]